MGRCDDLSSIGYAGITVTELHQLDRKNGTVVRVQCVPEMDREACDLSRANGCAANLTDADESNRISTESGGGRSLDHAVMGTSFDSHKNDRSACDMRSSLSSSKHHRVATLRNIRMASDADVGLTAWQSQRNPPCAAAPQCRQTGSRQPDSPRWGERNAGSSPYRSRSHAGSTHSR